MKTNRSKRKVPEQIRREIKLYKELHPRVTQRKLIDIFEKKIGWRPSTWTIHRILKSDLSIVEEEAVKSAKSQYVQKYGGEMAQIMLEIDKNESEALAKAVAGLNKTMDLTKDPMDYLKMYIELKKAKYGQIVDVMEFNFTPDKLKKYENINKLLDEAIKQKIKVSRKITKTGLRPTTEDERGYKPDDTDREETSGTGEN